MSATYNNQIEIVVFNNNRATNPKAPQKTGVVTFPDGSKYDVALWERKGKSGTEFLAGVLKPQTDRPSNNGSSNDRVNVDF